MAMKDELTGQIVRVTFTNAETGFTIARLKTKGRREPLTVVGTIPEPQVGETLKLTGQWTHHPKYGRQFQVASCSSLLPGSVQGIQGFLGSGLVKGIGPVMAARIVEKFGTATLDVIDTEPDKLLQVAGIGPKRLALIRRGWEERKSIREVMVFLQSHEVSTAFASRIYRAYGEDSSRVLTSDPYRLAREVPGIGFLSADRIARKLGISEHDPRRTRAALLYVLQQLVSEGHVFVPLDTLKTEADKLLQLEDLQKFEEAVKALQDDDQVVVERQTSATEAESADQENRIYLKPFYLMELAVTRRLLELAQGRSVLASIDTEKAALWVQKRLSIKLARQQAEAVRRSLKEKLVIITGGPGTGKTTVLRAILRIVSGKRIPVLLAAPTGRAAKRMSEATGFPARTLHRLLEFSPKSGTFQRNDRHPLPCQMLILDEASMIDIVLMHHLLKALPPSATLILVGDADQLPSVGPGQVLADLIDSGLASVVHLDHVFRQKRGSSIVVNAHRINKGRMPVLTEGAQGTDFFFVQAQDPEDILALICRLVSERIPERFKLHPIDGIQVLTPMRRGLLGVDNLNLRLQQHLNPRAPQMGHAGRIFRAGDKVMQIRNNYEKEVFNGDLGRITDIDFECGSLWVAFEGGRRLSYGTLELDELVLAYAISVHKSQGSEYPAVVLPLHTQHYMMLRKNLLYTAVTRAKQLLVLVGTRRALSIAVHTKTDRRRFSLLAGRLKSSQMVAFPAEDSAQPRPPWS